MKAQIMRRHRGRWSCVGSLFLGLLILVSSAMAVDDNPEDQILFLQLKVDTSGISLIDHILADGRLKEARVPVRTHGLACRLVDRAGESQFETIVENPLLKKYEYEDPNRPGELIMKLVELDEAEFWVRLPVREQMDRLEFRLEDSRVSPSARPLDPRLTGSIDLTFLEGRQK